MIKVTLTSMLTSLLQTTMPYRLAVWRTTTVIVPHLGELEAVHGAPAQWLLFL